METLRKIHKQKLYAQRSSSLSYHKDHSFPLIYLWSAVGAIRRAKMHLWRTNFQKGTITEVLDPPGNFCRLIFNSFPVRVCPFEIPSAGLPRIYLAVSREKSLAPLFNSARFLLALSVSSSGCRAPLFSQPAGSIQRNCCRSRLQRYFAIPCICLLAFVLRTSYFPRRCFVSTFSQLL